MMDIAKKYNKLDSDTKSTIGAWMIGIGIVIAVIVYLVIASSRDLTLAEEEKKCREVVTGTAIEKDIYGYCDTYIGSDGDLHYKYVQTSDPADTSEYYEKDVYIIWETGKGGKY